MHAHQQTNMNAEEPHCQLWREWSDIAHVQPNTVDAYVFNYFFYVLFAVVFASLAGLYVTALAPYAAGSGIPEVRSSYVASGVLTECVLTEFINSVRTVDGY